MALSTSPQPPSRKAASTRSQRSATSSETTPLLADQDDGAPREESQEEEISKPSRWRRWPSVLALALLCMTIFLILVAGFLVPQAVKEYATEALIFEPTSLTVISLTSSGVLANVQGDFVLDASRVKNRASRNIGRLATAIAKKVESSSSQIEVSLPEYGDVILGRADVPGMTFDIRNGHNTHLNFTTELVPGSNEGIRQIADEWLEGRIKHLQFKGETSVNVKSGIFSLGSQSIQHYLTLKGKEIPTMPKYNISRSMFHEIDEPDSKGLRAEAILQVNNDYPFDFMVPPLNFGIFVDNCSPDEPYIRLADAHISSLHLEPKQDLNVKVTGLIHDLPKAVLRKCPGYQMSPLDSMLGRYIEGKETTVYVRGSDTPSAETPKWLADLMSQLTVPVPFPGHAFGHLVKDFILKDVHLELPNPSDSSDSKQITPKISAHVRALVVVPEEMNFPIKVHGFRAVGDVSYHGKKLGVLSLNEWRSAKSKPVKNNVTGHEDLEVISMMDNVPLTVTDNDVLVDVVQDLIRSNDTLLLSIKSDVDAALQTSLGEFVVRGIPTEGEIPIKPLVGANYKSFSPRVDDMRVVQTTGRSITLQAAMNFTNPTPYSATLPLVDVSIMVNGTRLGHASVKGVSVKPGFNARVPVTAVWNPWDASGRDGGAIGKELLSQYISGYNTTITIRTNADTFPSHPSLGKALEVIEIEMPTPKLKPTPRIEDPDDDDEPEDDGKPHFIEDATMHLLTSRATFTILSPLEHNTIYITSINATAYYKGDPVGNIEYYDTLEVPPGASETPRLPVSWNLGSVGYEAVRKALGGVLKLEARATIGVRIGEFQEEVWFVGDGIGAKVRI